MKRFLNIKIIIVIIIGWMSIEGVVIDLFSVFVDPPVAKQEEIVCKEYEQLDFSQYAYVSTFVINKRALSRSIRASYKYTINEEQVEKYCIEELEKYDWILYKTRKAENNKKTIIFLKENTYCLLEFSEGKIFSVNIYYKGINKRINEVY